MSQLPAQLLHDLKSISGTAGFRPACERDTSDPRGRYSGNSKWVFRPADTNTLAQIIARCAEARQAVIPLGGATGLVAGHIDQSNRPSVLLSTERLNKIRKVDADDSVLVAEAGAVLANVQQAAAQHRLLFPLSLASEGSCTLGGNLATNAGGVQVLRYGNTRDLVLGIEAVMPNGSVLHNLSPLRKDNTGYDIKNLLIGSEGTLGLITAASLKLFPEVKEHCTALCPLPSPAHALKLLTFLKSAFAESISAFELLAGQGLMFLTEHFPNLQQAHSPPAKWSVLIELGNTRAVSMASDFEQGLAKALEKELITDAVICQSESQRQQLWQLREHIPLANAKVGAVVSFDISLPLSALPSFISAGKAKLAQTHPDLRINCFGHVGDGNLHFNVFPPSRKKAADYKDLSSRIRHDIYDLVHDYSGSFSAEHGVGRDKVVELRRYADPTRLQTMRALKAALDPLNIFNPGALFAQVD